jgi:hypothetical protein
MKLLGFAIAWAGYTLIWWGWSSIQGPGVGFMDLVTPGRVPTRAPKDQASAAAQTPGLTTGGLPPVTPNLPSGAPDIGNGFATGPILGHNG